MPRTSATYFGFTPGSGGVGVSATVSSSTGPGTAFPTYRIKTEYGFGEGECSCSRCMRKSGPTREDSRARIIQLCEVLSGYDGTDEQGECDEDIYNQASELVDCVERGDDKGLSDALAEIAEDDIAYQVASDLLLSAAQLGFANIISVLLRNGADTEQADMCGLGGNALMHAANNGHLAAVKELIKGKALLEARDSNHYTPLIIAVFCDRSSVAEALLTAGANSEAVDYRQRTALSYCALYGAVDCISVLAAHKANPFHTDADGKTPLMLAEGCSRLDAVEALKKFQRKAAMDTKRQQRELMKQMAEVSSSGADEERLKREAESIGNALIAEEDAAKAAAAEAAAKAAAAKKAAAKAKKQGAKLAKATKQQQQQQASAAVSAAASSSDADEHSRSDPRASTTGAAQGGVHNNGAATAPPTAAGPVHAAPSDGAAQAAATGRVSRHWLDELLTARVTPPAVTSSSQSAAPSHLPPRPSPPPVASPPAFLSHMVAPNLAASNGHGGAAAEAGGTGGGTAASGGTGGVSAAAAARVTEVVAAIAQLAGDLLLRGDELRQRWDAVVDEASKCVDEARQPLLLRQVQSLLPVCVKEGISVKYGRKVLQRLEGVAPARDALRKVLAAAAAAAAGTPAHASPTAAEVNEALRASRGVRVLLDNGLVEQVEKLQARLAQQEEQKRWDHLAAQLARSQLGGTGPPAGHAPGSTGLPRGIAPGGTRVGDSPAASPAGVPSAANNHRMLQLSPRSATTKPTAALAASAAGVTTNVPLDEDMECSVCWAAPKDHCCIPCGHVCLCKLCAQSVLEQAAAVCPICRTPIATILDIQSG